MRLNKFISNSGICSRREADKFISMGLVKVNGKVITKMGYKIEPKDNVTFDEIKINSENSVYVLINKPKGYIFSKKNQYKKNITQLINIENSSKLISLYTSNRKSMGVLFLSNDHAFVDNLKNSKNPIKKILEITLDKKLIKSDLEKIKKKIFRKSHFRGNKEIINFVSGELKNKVGVETFYKDINEIYNFFEFFGYKIISSDVSVWGPLTKKKLERGQWRFLSKDEISILKML
tara:strand:- start:11760 stop:12461 length:702 start_codon:yes stop_codon:yes gene_type:complete